MRGSAKPVFGFSALLISMLLFGACDNDINKIKEISARQSTNPVTQTTGVDVIYSDSAKVKVHMTAPLMLKLETPAARAYSMMPKGVKIVFYDSTRHESGNIVADSAIQHTNDNIIEFYKNVVATNAAGETFKSEELIWDPNKKLMYSSKPVQITMSGGTTMAGADFTSDDKLMHPILKKSTGVFPVSDMPGKQ